MNRQASGNPSLLLIALAGFLTLTCLATFAPGRGQEPPKKPDNPGKDADFPATLEVSATKLDANGMQKITAAVILQPDFLIFANEPGDENFLPAKTTMTIAGQKQSKVKITYSKGEPMELKGEGSNIRVYRRKVVFEAEVERPLGDNGPLEVVVRLQPYNEKVLSCSWLPTKLIKVVP